MSNLTTISIDALVRLLIDIRDERAELAAQAAEYEQELISRAPSKKFLIDGVGEVQIRHSLKRTDWDSEGLTRVLVAYALDERKLDEATGEYEPGWEAVARVLTECARPSWRVTPLKSRGIDPDEFCHSEPDHAAVQLPPRGN